MPRSACIHPSHRETISLALKRNGFLTQGELAAHLEIALSTVNNFCRGVNVSVAKFEEICDALGLTARALVQPASQAVEPSQDTVPMAASSSDEAIAPSPQPLESFFAYDSAWVGREAVIEDMSERLSAHHRLLLIVGIAGVGKTALAERLVLATQTQRPLIRLNFDHQEQTQDFGSVAARLLEKCGQPVTREARQHPAQLRQQLFNHLQTHDYLVLIDSLEEILEGDEQGESRFQDGDYLAFLQQVLAADTFQSRILVTSQELPAELLAFGTRYQPLWHCHLLVGLSHTEQVALFAKLGFDLNGGDTGFAQASQRPYLTRIGKAYEGHPLALRVILGEIGSRPFFGNVMAYWQRYGREIEEVERSLAEAAAGNLTGADDKWALDRFTRALRRNVRRRLEQTFQRLQRDARPAYILLCEAAVYRCPVPEDWWLSHLDYWSLDNATQAAAMDALKDRFLVEEVVEDDCYQLKQHNLIRSVALEHLQQLTFADGAEPTDQTDA